MTTRKDPLTPSSTFSVASSAMTADGRTIPVEVLPPLSPAVQDAVRPRRPRRRVKALAVIPKAVVAPSAFCLLCGGRVDVARAKVRLGPLYALVCRSCVDVATGSMRIVARLLG